MINIAVVDGEDSSLSEYIKSYSETIGKNIVNYKLFKNKKTLLKNLCSEFEAYPLIYLDINLSDLKDIEISNKIKSSAKNSKVVFVTYITYFSRESFKKTPNEYILRPLKKDIVYDSIKNSLRDKMQKTIFRV